MMLSLSVPVHACHPALVMADLLMPFLNVVSLFWTSKIRHLLPLVSWHCWYDDYAAALYSAMGTVQMTLCLEGESGTCYSHTLNCWWKCQQDSTGDDDKPSDGSHETDQVRYAIPQGHIFKYFLYLVFLCPVLIRSLALRCFALSAYCLSLPYNHLVFSTSLLVSLTFIAVWLIKES